MASRTLIKVAGADPRAATEFNREPELKFQLEQTGNDYVLIFAFTSVNQWPMAFLARIHPTPRNYGLQGGPFYQYICWTSPYTPLDPEPLPEGSALK